ncbi:hypothetical protein Ddc_08887 [Ditylenchus destructor]|nr:hypothetical protein Ddc_08887 [Ditylenchus destructor]
MGVNGAPWSTPGKLRKYGYFSHRAMLSTTGRQNNNYNRSGTRGIVHSLTESGLARLIFDEDFGHFRGILLNSREESVSLTGTLSKKFPTATIEELLPVSNGKKDPSRASTSKMQIIVVDGETGDKYCIENVTVSTITKKHEITNASQIWVEINHPAIKFKTEEVLIGNRADVEIQKYLDPTTQLVRMSSRSSEHNRVYVGTMVVNVVASVKTEPSSRRMSGCEGCATNVISQSDDFLV